MCQCGLETLAPAAIAVGPVLLTSLRVKLAGGWSAGEPEAPAATTPPESA